MSQPNISDQEFSQIAIECDLDPKAVKKKLKSLYPNIRHRLERIETRLNTLRKKGTLPLNSGNSVSPGEFLKGTSTLYDADGAIKQQWVKTDVAKANLLEDFSLAIDSLLERVPLKDPIPLPKTASLVDDTMSVYTIGDAHIGMLAWHREVGEDNDLEIAQRDLIQAMDLLVSQSTASKEAFIVDVGDFYHSDNYDNKTTRSGAPLDVDGRYPKVLEIGLMLTTRLIDLALQKHEVVHWRSAIGNHNDHSAIMMSQFIKAWYRNEPRVVVHDEPGMFMYHQFGKNLIGITHGHTAKADKLGEIMAVDCSDLWSATKYRYWYCGHIHHQSVKEYPSCVVETFRTLAGKDAWHHASGYRSGQDMKCITLHKDYGEISRNTVSLYQVRNSTSPTSAQ